MATRTISNTGGNYNAVGTWVEGIVPTSADDVVSTATSGPLTINVSSAARSFNLTTYTNTLTISQFWSIGGNTVANVFGSDMSFTAPTSTSIFRIILTNASTLAQYTTNRIPGLRFAAGVKTLLTDIYCVHFDINTSSNAISNGFTLYSSGNLGSETSYNTVGGQQPGFYGTTKLVLDGTGIISMNVASEIEINTTGTYSTNYIGLVINGVAGYSQKVSITAGNISDSFVLSIGKSSLSIPNVSITSNVEIPNLLIFNLYVSSLARNMNIYLLKSMSIANISILSSFRAGTSDNATQIISIYGFGLSASNVTLFPSQKTGSSTTVFEYNSKGPDLRLCSGVTHSIGTLMAIGGSITDKATISSTTASSPCTLKLGTKEGSQIINYNFTDVNASSGAQVVAINATVSNCTNVTNVYPTGGTPSGGGGGAWTFIN